MAGQLHLKFHGAHLEPKGEKGELGEGGE